MSLYLHHTRPPLNCQDKFLNQWFFIFNFLLFSNEKDTQPFDFLYKQPKRKKLVCTLRNSYVQKVRLGHPCLYGLFISMRLPEQGLRAIPEDVLAQVQSAFKRSINAVHALMPGLTVYDYVCTCKRYGCICTAWKRSKDWENDVYCLYEAQESVKSSFPQLYTCGFLILTSTMLTILEEHTIRKR